ncbi:hypothetical protein OG802_34590 [Streptomyces sp. NBC_00704]|uniref:imidazole glycerol phosphate synthase subunit HisH n=1 Tax=Streptomyces sp. NBC_00704 TaxID=2975809 RepID=UPI002E36ED1B|nr:hypothetical protein [Streptomyces sp. NBC_00704]
MPGPATRDRTAFNGADVRVPQMGWNQVHRTSAHPFLAGLPEAGHFYFVNSYYADPADSRKGAATTEYGLPFTSAVTHGNMMATQFHTEKSGPLGLGLIERFARTPQEELCPA